MCDCCDKAFPLRSALDLHKTTAHTDRPSTSNAQEADAEDGAAENAMESQDAEVVLPQEQATFLEGLGLQHISKVNLKILDCTTASYSSDIG